MMRQDRDFADRLNDRLDALASGAAQPLPDPSLALGDTVARFFAADDAPGPPPGFSDQLWEDLMTQFAQDETTAWLFAPLAAANGHRPAHPLPRRPGARGLRRPPWASVHLATAALVLLALLGGLAAAGHLMRFDWGGQRPAILPAPVRNDAPPLSFIREITGGDDPLQNPSGVAVDPDGNLYVVDTSRDQIRVFDPQGQPVTAWGTPGSKPGQLRLSISGWGDLAIAQDGSVLVLDPTYNQVHQFTTDGTFVRAWGGPGGTSGQLVDPSGIAVDAEGRIHVADYTMHVFDAEGELLTTWNGEQRDGPNLAGPSDVAVGPDGIAWATYGGLHRVIGFNADGTVAASFGGIGDAPGQ
ncbi:MAG: hypothetical protein KC442_08095, partial [Thermomicrobiales bacterium]|nr:hypothetical protein [Thermomicrobiales bacterium]